MLEMPAMLDIRQGKLYTLSGGVERVSLGLPWVWKGWRSSPTKPNGVIIRPRNHTKDALCSVCPAKVHFNFMSRLIFVGNISGS